MCVMLRVRCIGCMGCVHACMRACECVCACTCFTLCIHHTLHKADQVSEVPAIGILSPGLNLNSL